MSAVAVSSKWAGFGGLAVGVGRLRRPLAVELERPVPSDTAHIFNEKRQVRRGSGGFEAKNTHRKAWNDGGYAVKSLPPVTAPAPAWACKCCGTTPAAAAA